MYADGPGVALDYVRAHMWFNLGAVSGNASAVENRDITAKPMTPQRFAEAQKMTRECQQRKFRDRNVENDRRADSRGARVRAGMSRDCAQVIGNPFVALLAALLLGVGTVWAGPLEDGGAAFKRGDYAEAYKWYRLAGAQGSADARFVLGTMYGIGQGVAQDHAESRNWFRLAAAQGEVHAQTALGLAYLFGRDGGVKNTAEALKWLRLAVAQGEANAQYALGAMYHEGHGVVQDYAETVKLYRLAAAQGVANAQMGLGNMYYEGLGVAQDYVRAHMWFNLGAVLGNADAVKNRDITATLMTPQQIAEAQKMASDCQRRNFKGCD